ncbi:MAG: CTP synthase [Chloroflexota bacterium]|nr:CTP synthase [Chloroflexota bacterium]
MDQVRKYIFCTGGVLSGVGKGVTAGSVGRILKARGATVSIQKLDPYINVDPGTMSPYQHGEVFVTEDGAETDLDLGHYERFIDESLTKDSNVTTGQVYAEIIARERRGDFLGGTIQVIPHITDEIKRRIALVGEKTGAEVVIVEVGGTVGDIESLPFLEALRQMRQDVGRDRTFYIHVTFLPHIAATNELKTKPTQHSVRELRSIGIQPDAIIARADHPVDESVRDKISLFCDVEHRAVIPLVTTQVLYEVPLLLEDAGLDDFIAERLKLDAREPDLREWRDLVNRIRAPKPSLPIAIVGKYVELHDAYISVSEALDHAALAHNWDVDLHYVSSEDLERGRGWDRLKGISGIVVPGGFGERGIEGKIDTARWARENDVPYLGLCLGLQVMIVELARHAVGSDEPNSTEFDAHTEYPVIDLMPDQRSIVDKGGTMRLGLYPCQLVPGTKAAEAYDVPLVEERHRHRFEVNNAYRDLLSQAGLVFSGLSPDRRLVEISELENHPFMLGSQFHPEFRSRPTRPHPLFKAFIAAAIEHQESRIEKPAERTSRREEQ